MLTVLGVMVAVLGLISAVVAAGIGFLGWLGFSTIQKEAKARAVRVAKSTARFTAKEIASRIADVIATQIAERVATSVATAIAERVIKDVRDREQASELSETQAELITSIPVTLQKEEV